MSEPEFVYIISIVNYDTHFTRFATLSKEKSLELFDIVRKELIEECNDMIAHCIEDDKPEYIEMYASERDQLIAMKPGDDVHGDRPSIEVISLS